MRLNLIFELKPQPTMMLYFWTALLSKNTKSIPTLPSRSLHLNKFMTKKYQDCWSKVTICDLRATVVLFNRVQDVTRLNPRRAQRAILQRMDLIFEDKVYDVEHSSESIDTPIARRG